MEGGSQVLDQLAEVHTLIGDIVEDSLVAVALIFHVANLHLQSQSLGNLSALYHRGVLTRLGLTVFIHIYRTGYAIHALDVVGTLQVGLLQL